MIKLLFLCVVAGCGFLSACGDDSKGGVANGTGGQGGSGAGALPPCAEVCTNVIAAQCPSGPPTQADCVSGCETIRTGKCRAQYMALFECAGSNPSYDCNSNGFVFVVGCESADSALNTCLSTP
jgi:hypothetical protein